MLKYRASRLFKYSPPEKISSDYSEAETDQFRVEFESVARRHRICFFIFAASFLAAVPIALFAKQLVPWWITCAMGPAMVYLALFGARCPACRRRVDEMLRTFCPVCGGKIRKGGFLKARECLSCGERFGAG